ncbi:hypothetical protein INR49_019770, partial [Caranx melampygus]
SSSASRRSSINRRRSENLRFDEFGFALLTKRKDPKVHHRCHDYSYPHLSSLRSKSSVSCSATGMIQLHLQEPEVFVRGARAPGGFGVSEYGILSAIATLSETQNDLDLNPQQSSSCPDTCYSADDITLFRQIALDLQRSFPTHRSLMGESPEAIEGQAKLFRVLIAYARYNPQVGYSQGKTLRVTASVVFKTASGVAAFSKIR